MYGRGGTQVKAWEMAEPEDVGVSWRLRREKSDSELSLEHLPQRAMEDKGHYNLPGPSRMKHRKDPRNPKKLPKNHKSYIAPFADTSESEDVGASSSTGITKPFTLPTTYANHSVNGIPASPHEISFVMPRKRSIVNQGYVSSDT